MFKTKTNLSRLFLKAIVVAAVFTSCKKNDAVDVNSPASKIAESEHLVIPAAVGLPVNEPGSFTRLATYYAEGVQKYKAQAKTGVPGSYEWVFVAPQADLFDASNKKVGTHGAGPFWQLSAADSLFAQHYAPAKTIASPDANSIDWLMLKPKEGKIPTGIFAGVTYIQRIATVGGKAPAVLPTNASETVDVKYTAIYRFTQKN